MRGFVVVVVAAAAVVVVVGVVVLFFVVVVVVFAVVAVVVVFVPPLPLGVPLLPLSPPEADMVAYPLRGLWDSLPLHPLG